MNGNPGIRASYIGHSPDARSAVRENDRGYERSVPGIAPFTVGGSYLAISGRRFSWSGTVGIVNDPPTFVLSADWLTLVEKFGLTANVNDAARKG